MTEESTITADPEEHASVEVEPTAPTEVARGLRRTTGGQTLFDRFISPVVLPVAAVTAIIFVVLNISRALLAGVGGHGGEGAEGAAEGGGHATLPVVIAALITVSILVFASAFAAAKKMRRHTLAVFAAVAIGTVAFAGWLSVGDAQEKKVASSASPCDPPEATLTVLASNSLKFDKSEYSVAPGCLGLEFAGDASHTLVFEEPPPAPFPKFAGLGTKTFAIQPGEYTIYCDVPGHRAGGMVATLTVAGEAGPEAPAA
jgi:plastocyanin